MFTRCFKITSPMRFEVFIEDVDTTKLIVTPGYMAINASDMHSYLGRNDADEMRHAFPMCLIREATGSVLQDPSGKHEPGDAVLLLPDDTAPAGGDGFSRELLNIRGSNILPIPANTPEWVFCSCVATACAMIRKAKPGNGTPVAIWGDGTAAYIIALTLLHASNCAPIVIGQDDERLARFGNMQTLNMREHHKLPDIALAINTMQAGAGIDAINQALDKLARNGALLLDNLNIGPSTVDTRVIVQKEITLSGISARNRQDYTRAVQLMEQPEFLGLLKPLIQGTSRISNIRDFYHAFENEAASDAFGRHVYQLAF